MKLDSFGLAAVIVIPVSTVLVWVVAHFALPALPVLLGGVLLSLLLALRIKPLPWSALPAAPSRWQQALNLAVWPILTLPWLLPQATLLFDVVFSCWIVTTQTLAWRQQGTLALGWPQRTLWLIAAALFLLTSLLASDRSVLALVFGVLFGWVGLSGRRPRWGSPPPQA
ncbi:hypothetical protein [Vogesella sp. XCS3]|uniref:hypothetical protein n=1 Tax=Vogesella sp. XCS3 TaxID=2877939 RepID=UPI001D0B5352|nr:hypothetical protein [Vogesella sp. XCS3]UDM16017.1 hypothetical protein LCH97_11980 [Vogesella sp. XCS3]